MVRSILATAVGACEMLRSRCGLGFLWSVWLCVWVALELFEDGFLGGGLSRAFPRALLGLFCLLNPTSSADVSTVTMT